MKSENIKYAYTLADRSVYPDDDNYAIPRVLVNEDSFNKLIKNGMVLKMASQNKKKKNSSTSEHFSVLLLSSHIY